jgi:hypothetical protein
MANPIPANRRGVLRQGQTACCPTRRLRLRVNADAVGGLATGFDVEFGRAGVDDFRKLHFHQVETDVTGGQGGAGHFDRRAVQVDLYRGHHPGRGFQGRGQAGGPFRLDAAQAGGQDLDSGIRTRHSLPMYWGLLLRWRAYCAWVIRIGLSDVDSNLPGIVKGTR